MQDILGLIESLRRPRLLVRAARFGIDDYCRTRHLGRILKSDRLPSPGQALMKLMDMESVMNVARKEKHTDYSCARHVEVMIAIMGEARLFRATRRPVAID